MERLPSYPSVLAVGHKMIQDLFKGPVVIEEKIDGSQFSAGKIRAVGDRHTPPTWQILMRSKGADLYHPTDNKMFKLAVDAIQERKSMLVPDWVYRFEYLSKSKHNTLCYDRVPMGNLVLFDIEKGVGTHNYATARERYDIAKELEVEPVPVLYQDEVDDIELIKQFIGTPSILGGCNIEGVVIKNYSVFTDDHKIAIGKYVDEKFKEVHRGDWKERNPSSGDIIQKLIDSYRTPARWQKAVQHLRDSGMLQHAPQDIPALMQEVGLDVLKEEEQEIRDALFKFAWPKIQRGIQAGLAEWYKNYLLESAFETESVG